MHAPYHIHFLHRKELDTEKWDACAHLIYGQSYYLDHMTERQWDALVMGDYEAVMPLTWKKKWGVRYLYQPEFTQQLGIFSKDPIPSQLTEAFLKELGRHYKFAEIFLNYLNKHPDLRPFTNFILHLNAPYHKLERQYKGKLKYSLTKARHASLQYAADIAPVTVHSLYIQLYGRRMPHVKAKAYSRFQTLCHFLQEKGQLLVRGVRDHRQQLLATALLLRDKNRLYLMQSAVTAEGRKEQAGHFLLDRLIHEFAGQPLILDFEGSEEPGIAFFYKNFGSEDQPYYFLRRNELGWPWRLFKQ